MYRIGDRILIMRMNGEPSYAGKSGTIEHIDDMGYLHGTWGGLAVIPEEDHIRLLN